MKTDQMIALIQRWIDNKESQAANVSDPVVLNQIYSHIADLKTIKLWLEQSCINPPKLEAPRGRLVVNVNARDRAEALAALELARDHIMTTTRQNCDRVSESVYVTNEGCVWGG